MEDVQTALYHFMKISYFQKHLHCFLSLDVISDKRKQISDKIIITTTTINRIYTDIHIILTTFPSSSAIKQCAVGSSTIR